MRVYGNDKWNLVCGDNWTQKEALVVCKSLGFEDGRAMPKSAFGPQTHNITIPYVKCKGSEKSVFDCDVGAFSNDSCASFTYASVYCSNETIANAREYKVQAGSTMLVSVASLVIISRL